MMSRFLRACLLLMIVVTFAYLIWLIHAFSTQEKPHHPQLGTLSPSEQRTLHNLEVEYETIHLKRLIIDEYKAIMTAQQTIAQIMHSRDSVSNNLHLGPQWPEANIKALLNPNIPGNLSSQLLSNPSSTFKHQKVNTFTATKTQQTSSNAGPKSDSASSPHGSASLKSPLQAGDTEVKHSAPEHTQHLLAMTPQETKSFQALKHFIAEKRQGKPLALTEDEKILLAMPSKHYTLQIFGARLRDTVLAFIHRHKIKSPYIFHSYYLNRPWFTLVTGKFKSYDAAIKGLKELPNMHEEPWIRPLSSVQAAIKLYR